jgi:hypothetical protein
MASVLGRHLIRSFWQVNGCECLLFKLNHGYEVCLWQKGLTVRREACEDEGTAREVAATWRTVSTEARRAPVE